jgi:hypothetical protein
LVQQVLLDQGEVTLEVLAGHQASPLFAVLLVVVEAMSRIMELLVV